MGHTMDADAREYYVRLEHFLTADWILGFAYNYQDRGIEAAKEGENLDRFLEKNGMDLTNLEDKQRFEIDVTYQKTDSFLAHAGYRYEKIDDVLGVRGATQDNHVFWVFMQYSF
jgi:predicted porin